MKESAFWKQLAKAWKYKGFFTRLESTTGAGIPDVVAVVNGKTFFIELKSGSINAMIKLRHAQIVFAHKTAKAGGHYIHLCRTVHGVTYSINSGPPTSFQGTYAQLLDKLIEEIN